LALNTRQFRPSARDIEKQQNNKLQKNHEKDIKSAKKKSKKNKQKNRKKKSF